MSDIVWSYRDSEWSQDRDLVGYEVEADGGKIGTVDEASNEAAAQWLVVDTGFWIFGKKRVIPAGTVTQLDLENELLGVGLTKDQIKDSPEFKPDTDDYRSQEYRSELGTYYGQYRS